MAGHCAMGGGSNSSHEVRDEVRVEEGLIEVSRKEIVEEQRCSWELAVAAAMTLLALVSMVLGFR